MNAPRTSAGFTLVELLIATALGLFVIGIAMTSFVSHVRSAELGQTLVTLQSQARFALGELTIAVRSAGYLGCAGASNVVPALPNSVGAVASTRTAWRPLDGFVVGTGTWTPGYPDGYGTGGYTPPINGPATPVAGSDALLVEGGVSQGSASVSGVGSNLSVGLIEPVIGLTPGAMALIGNCSGSEVFEVKSVTTNTDGSASVVPEKPFLAPYEYKPAFPLATRVIPYRRALYFVGDTNRTSENGEPILALYEHLHPFVDTVPEALADGVEAMVVRYRQRAANGATQELAADNLAFDPALVTGVTVGLLISNEGYRPPADEQPVYRLAGVVVGTASESESPDTSEDTSGGGTTPAPAATAIPPTHPNDTRMRRAFERSVVVRSRVESGIAP